MRTPGPVIPGQVVVWGIAPSDMLRRMPEVGGTEIQFADGKFVVDDVYVAPIMEATKRQPERYGYQDAMRLMNEVFSKDMLRNAQSRVVSDHLRQHGV